MKRFVYVLVFFTIAAGVALTAIAPDTLSMAFAAAMVFVICLGSFFGLLPVIGFTSAFVRGEDAIEDAAASRQDNAWLAFMQQEQVFHNRTLDDLFADYRDKVMMQRDANQIMSDIDDYINEEVLSVRTWQNVVAQIPGTMTGLGILGTFIGLILGISGIGFSSVDQAISSVQNLLSGIQVAFYTSISGVILSILFNITNRTAWNLMVREMMLFTELFQKNIQPTEKEQELYLRAHEYDQIMERLNRIPRDAGFSMANSGQAVQNAERVSENEKFLMPQIIDGLRKGEFVFYLQPRYDLHTRAIVAAEALVRWKHSTIGLISPSVFVPILERNGYITKMDQNVWEQVFREIRKSIDAGDRPVPVSINVSKTDILAMDVPSFFAGMLEKYRIPPRMVEVEIAENVYRESHGEVQEVEKKLRNAGFRVIVDGFDGDFVSLRAADAVHADGLKLDLRYYLKNNDESMLPGTFEEARNLQLPMSCEGIENTQQLNDLRRSGCSEGQGYLFSKPLPLEEFKKLIAPHTA